MTNLYEETIEVMTENNLEWDDIEWVGGNNFQITLDNFREIAKKTEYNNGFGDAEVAGDLVIMAKSWIMYREEYDGAECWKIIKLKPSRPTNVETIYCLSQYNSDEKDARWMTDLVGLNGMKRKYNINRYV